MRITQGGSALVVRGHIYTRYVVDDIHKWHMGATDTLLLPDK
jgi:hypothetical protein